MGNSTLSGEFAMYCSIDRQRLAQLRATEGAQFERRTPRSAALRTRAAAHLPNSVPMSWMSNLYPTPPIYAESGSGAIFRDVDGNDYLDFNVCDLSMTVGFGNEIVASTLAAQARRGTQFLLATEDAIAVAEQLAGRMHHPYWQFTLSASGANTEVARAARFLTRRSRIVIFGGHYHGHIDETLVREEQGRSVPDNPGLTPGTAAHTTLLPFNDLAALERTLAAGDVALVLTEPALTNCNVVLPAAGFHKGLRELTQRHGTLLCLDEAHTVQFAYGGLTNAWQLDADFIVLGKGLGTGVSFGLYGMSEAVGAAYARHIDLYVEPRGMATGGTTYATPLATATARATLEQILTAEAHARINALGKGLADGLEAVFARRSLPWRAFHCGPRSGYCLAPRLPVNGREAADSLDYDFINARRAYMANRGVWDAVSSAGPQASLAHSAADIDRYVELADAFLGEIN